MAATTFAVYTGFAFVLPFLPLYLRELGVRSDADAALWAGVIIGIAPLLAGLVAPLWGRVADRRGARTVALVALGTYAVLLVLSARVSRAWQLLGLRAALGLSGGIGPISLAMATAGVPREETGRAVGALQAAQILAAAAGPLAGGLCVGAFVLVLALYVEPSSVDAAAARGSWRDAVGIPGLLPLAAVLFLVNFIGRSFTPVLPAYLATLGVAIARIPSRAGLLICAYSVAAALSATLLGRASRDRDPRSLLAATLLGGALVVAPMGLAHSYLPLLGLGALLGLVAGGSLTLCYTLGGLVAPGASRATAFGLLSGAALVGGALSPSLAGALARYDLRLIFWVDALLYAAVGLALLGARPRLRDSMGA
jgi:DHA1 family multidrug resistance protein-like MFS transporter